MEEQYKSRLIKSVGILSITMTASMMVVQSHANNTLNDDALSEQTDRLQKVTPEVITQLKNDAQLDASEQVKIQQQLAQKQSMQIKKQVLESNAASDYEIKRKTDPSKLLNVEKHEFIPPKPAKVIYNIEFENKNVQIGTNFK